MANTSQALKERVAGKAAEGAVANRPKTLTEQINALVPQMARVLMSNQKADRLARIAITEFKKNPALAQCDPSTFFGSLLTAAQHNLEPGVLGHAYLIPYRGQVTLQLGYRGLLELVGRSEKVDSVYAYAVYKGDVFKFTLGATPNVIHEPCGDAEDANLTHVYAIAHIKGSTIPRIEVMTRKQVDGIRGRSQSDQAAKKYEKKTPWDTDYAEMARKTVLKRLCKTLPMSIDSMVAVMDDEAVHRANLTTMEIDDTVSMFEVKPETVETVDEATGEVTEQKKGAGRKQKPAAEAEPAQEAEVVTEGAPHPAEEPPAAGGAAQGKPLFP